MNDVQRPDGIERRHIHEAHGSTLHAWPTGLVGLAILLGAGAVGLFGIRDRITATGDGVVLTVEGPARIRSGEYFEMRFIVETRRKIRDAVLTVDETIWQDVTVNTMVPAPAEEGFRDGAFELHFGTLRPGARLLVKIDGQINPAYPPGVNGGRIELVDGATTLASVDYSMRIFP